MNVLVGHRARILGAWFIGARGNEPDRRLDEVPVSLFADGRLVGVGDIVESGETLTAKVELPEDIRWAGPPVADLEFL